MPSTKPSEQKKQIQTTQPDPREIANWLQEQGCKKIISKFWEGNTIAEYSNGKIEVYIIENFKDYPIFTSLQDKRHKVERLER